MGAFQVKADDQIADRASAAIEQYRANHQLANRGDALAELLPLLERAAVTGGTDPEAEKMLGQVKSLTAAIEVEVQALATRVTTARAAERSAAAADLDNAQQVAQAAKEEADRYREQAEELEQDLENAKAVIAEREAEIQQLKDMLNAALGLKQQVEQGC